MKSRWPWLAAFFLISLPLVLGLEALVLRLPAPFSQINIPIIFLSISLLIFKSGGIVWYAAALYTMLDMYTATPFGLVLLVGTLAMLVVLWLYRAVITNQGILAAALVTATLVSLFNIFYACARLFMSIFFDLPFFGAAWFALFVTELVCTVLTVVILYAILSKIIPALKVTHARSGPVYVRD